MDNRIVLLGAGGHCKVIIDAICSTGLYKIAGVVDLNCNYKSKILGIPVIGNDDILPKIFDSGIKNAFVAIGSISDCSLRKKLCKKVKQIGFRLPVISHTKSVIANDVQIGEGTFIAPGAVINAGTKVGRNSIINTSASVDHDCRIGDFVHIAPGVTLCGEVEVGNETHIGVGANVIQCIKIGKRRFIKAGSLVKSNQPDNSK